MARELQSAEQSEVAHFVAKWHQREPEMALAEVFCPREMRGRFRCWGSLLHELREARFELSDARVRDAKTAWWADELLGWAQRRSRHPLGKVLVAFDAPWASLGQALLTANTSEQRPATIDEALLEFRPLAGAVVAVEAALLGGASEDVLDSALELSVCRHWLLHRLPKGLQAEDQAGIPLQLLARHGTARLDLSEASSVQLLSDWAGAMMRSAPAILSHGTLFRRARNHFDMVRLSQWAAGNGLAEPNALASLFRAWRAAIKA